MKSTSLKPSTFNNKIWQKR